MIFVYLFVRCFQALTEWATSDASTRLWTQLEGLCNRCGIHNGGGTSNSLHVEIQTLFVRYPLLGTSQQRVFKVLQSSWSVLW